MDDACRHTCSRSLLLVALLVGLGSGRGYGDAARAGWLTIGGHRLGQPAEFAKLTVVLMLARVLAQNQVAPQVDDRAVEADRSSPACRCC